MHDTRAQNIQIGTASMTFFLEGPVKVLSCLNETYASLSALQIIKYMYAFSISGLSSE